jgi:hypothetical protein
MQKTEIFDVEGSRNLVTEREILRGKEWLTTKEAAIYLDVSIPTVNKWCRIGAATKQKVVGKNYFSRSKLDLIMGGEEGGLNG